jgi:hypothetical protein
VLPDVLHCCHSYRTTGTHQASFVAAKPELVLSINGTAVRLLQHYNVVLLQRLCVTSSHVLCAGYELHLAFWQEELHPGTSGACPGEGQGAVLPSTRLEQVGSRACNLPRLESLPCKGAVSLSTSFTSRLHPIARALQLSSGHNGTYRHSI